MSDDTLSSIKLHFEPSTLETIDASVVGFLKSLNLFAKTNKGSTRVPVIWGTAERSYQSKKDKEIRDEHGMLVLPIMTVVRTNTTKDLGSKGVFQGNVWEDNDVQGGSMPVTRVIYQEKTMKFANADAKRLTGQLNFPRNNAKIVYKTLVAPMPVNVSVTYEITIRTEYQQQMNNLLLPFITKPGTINSVSLVEGEHRFEGFIQEEYSNSNNVSDFSDDERKFETKITLKVVGYLVGQGKNRDKPYYAIRENAVEVKIPRERVSLSEVPEHEYGSYYGLAGIPSGFDKTCPPSIKSLFGNVPAVGSPVCTTAGSAEVNSSTVVTRSNFGDVLNDFLVVRTLLKDDETPIPDGTSRTVFTVAGSSIKANTESVYVNGLIQAAGDGKDYTISGNTITFSDDIEDMDSIYVTYIVG